VTAIVRLDVRWACASGSEREADDTKGDPRRIRATDAVTTATGLCRGGGARSQAVLGAFAARGGLGQDQAMRIASGFAKGMRLGDVVWSGDGCLHFARPRARNPGV
jgi:hypothetical protein